MPWLAYPLEAAADKRYDDLRATKGAEEKRKISTPSRIKPSFISCPDCTLAATPAALVCLALVQSEKKLND
jgi:hypothetical protein